MPGGRLLVTLAALATIGSAAISLGGTNHPRAAAELSRRAVIPMIAADSATNAQPIPTVSPTPVQGGIMDGRWTGTFVNTFPLAGTGTFELQLSQTGQQYSGTATIYDSPCITTATVTGTISGSSLQFGVVSGTVSIEYSGTLTGNGASGTYLASAACLNATGTWSATKQ